MNNTQESTLFVNQKAFSSQVTNDIYLKSEYLLCKYLTRIETLYSILINSNKKKSLIFNPKYNFIVTNKRRSINNYIKEAFPLRKCIKSFFKNIKIHCKKILQNTFFFWIVKTGTHIKNSIKWTSLKLLSFFIIFNLIITRLGFMLLQVVRSNLFDQ